MANKTITFAYDEDLHASIVEAFARAKKYQDTIPDPGDPEQTIPNPESKEDFTGRMILAYVADVANKYTPARDAAKAAMETAETQIKSTVEAALGATQVSFS